MLTQSLLEREVDALVGAERYDPPDPRATYRALPTAALGDAGERD